MKPHCNRYHPGDCVMVKEHDPSLLCENLTGWTEFENKFRGHVVTIKEIKKMNLSDDSYYLIEESPYATFWDEDFVDFEESQACKGSLDEYLE